LTPASRLVDASIARRDLADRSVAIDLATGRIETTAMASIAKEDNPTLSPGISVRVEGDDVEIVVVLDLHAACAPAPCFADERYVARTGVTATINGRDAT